MKFPFKKALVTGGAGFIGSHIVEELINRHIETVSIDNYVTGKEENLEHVKDSPLLKIVNCDVTDYEKLKKIFDEEKFDIIFHQAASKKTVCLKDPRIDLDVNAKGTFNLLELSRDYNIKKFIHASTGSVYGEAKYYPQDEEHPLNPNSYYGCSKLAGERYAMAFKSLYNMNVTVLRYFHVFGPRQDYSNFGGVVSIFGRRVINNKPPLIFGDGSQMRSFTYVKDVVGINMLVAELSEQTNGEVYNCASGIKVTIKELAEKIMNIFNNVMEIEYSDWTPGDIKYFEVDNSKIKKLGFEFKTNFDEGLIKTMEWIKTVIK